MKEFQKFRDAASVLPDLGVGERITVNGRVMQVVRVQGHKALLDGAEAQREFPPRRPRDGRSYRGGRRPSGARYTSVIDE